MTSALKQNRLPAQKFEVTGCGDCPLRIDDEGFDEGDVPSECGHPDVPARAVDHSASEPPDFCPLLRAPLQLVIAGGGE